MKVKPGDVYLSKRTDIEPAKFKYQLYFDKETVLLINTKKSRYNVSVFLQMKDCPILKYDSYINVDAVFKFEKKCPIIKVCELSTQALINLRTMIRSSALMPQIQIKRIEQAISLILAERE